MVLCKCLNMQGNGEWVQNSSNIVIMKANEYTVEKKNKVKSVFIVLFLSLNIKEIEKGDFTYFQENLVK